MPGIASDDGLGNDESTEPSPLDGRAVRPAHDGMDELSWARSWVVSRGAAGLDALPTHRRRPVSVVVVVARGRRRTAGQLRHQAVGQEVVPRTGSRPPTTASPVANLSELAKGSGPPCRRRSPSAGRGRDRGGRSPSPCSRTPRAGASGNDEYVSRIPWDMSMQPSRMLIADVRSSSLHARASDGALRVVAQLEQARRGQAADQALRGATGFVPAGAAH